MSTDQTFNFGRIRTLLWPIHRVELKKFLPMFLIFFLICINYSLLRAAKDALVITAHQAGAEVIPFIKVWAILPMALLFTLLFTRLSNKHSREKVFYIMISIFIGFFALFAFVLYPCRDIIHPHGVCDQLQAGLPAGFKGLIGIFRNWSFTLFYVMSELWGTTIMTILFWGFANDVTSVKNAKRFYAILIMGANIASIVSGYISILLSKGALYQLFPGGSDPWGKCILFLTCVISVVGVAIIGLFYRLNRNVIDHEEAVDSVASNKKKKIKMGMRSNFAYLAKSKYLICIAVIVLAYNLSINMIEVIWKDQVKLLFPVPNDYNAYMGKVMMMMGALSSFVSIFLCGNVIRRFGWTVSAMITPITLFISAMLFFSFLLFRETGLGGIAVMMGTTPLALGVLFGAIQNSLARTCKYTLFDTTKEIAFIPLSPECKLKGKAAIDGVGSRLGKSGGSIIHQSLLMIFGTVSMSTPYVAGLLLLVIGAWTIATRSLGHQFKELTQEEAPAQNESLQEAMG